MGMISRIFSILFGDGRNVVTETAEVFRPNAEADASRAAAHQAAALAQFGAEFQARRGWFDQLVDGLNRLPRPALAYGTLGLFAMAMHDPAWFASRMQGIALVPEPLWWLMGAIVSFYFGARHQAHAQSFQRSVAQTMAHLPQVQAARAAAAPEPARASFLSSPPQGIGPKIYATGPNAALDEWRQLA